MVFCALSEAKGMDIIMSNYKDLREWIEIVKKDGGLKEIDGAHWNLEMSTLNELSVRSNPDNPPALLFNNIPDYPNIEYY